MQHGRAVLIIGLLFAAGLVAAGGVLIKQRLPVPFQDTYEVRAVVPAADGIAPGLGQSVNVSGVRVGSIDEARVVGPNAVLTMTIRRKKLDRVFRDARASLRPITPLKDMEIDLDPGTAAAGVLDHRGELPLESNSSPVPLADLLSTLDADTRGFVDGLFHGLSTGTAGRSADLRKVLLALGPASEDLALVAREAASRRRELARLVTNVSRAVDAASSDGRMTDLIGAASQTLTAVAAEEQAIGRSLDVLPRTLGRVDQTVTSLGQLSTDLAGASKVLRPGVRGLPATLRAVEPFMDELTTVVRRQVRPLALEAQPLAAELGRSVEAVRGITADLSHVAQVAVYALNEIGYNPPGKEEGMLFWMAWFAQNWNSSASTADAHGGILRVALNVSCVQITQLQDLAPLFRLLLGVNSICPVEP